MTCTCHQCLKSGPEGTGSSLVSSCQHWLSRERYLLLPAVSLVAVSATSISKLSMSSCSETHPKCLENWRASASSWWFLQLLDSRQESYEATQCLCVLQAPSPALFVQVMVVVSNQARDTWSCYQGACHPANPLVLQREPTRQDSDYLRRAPKVGSKFEQQLGGWKAGWRKKTGGGIKTYKNDWLIHTRYNQNIPFRDAPQPSQPMGKWSAALVPRPHVFPKKIQKGHHWVQRPYG